MTPQSTAGDDRDDCVDEDNDYDDDHVHSDTNDCDHDHDHEFGARLVLVHSLTKNYFCKTSFVFLGFNYFVLVFQTFFYCSLIAFQCCANLLKNCPFLPFPITNTYISK